MDLKKLAHDIANVYMENSKVEAVLLGGSVARNWHDEFSDIELFVFWKIDPTDHDRKYVINRVNGEVIDFYDFEDDEWRFHTNEHYGDTVWPKSYVCAPPSI